MSDIPVDIGCEEVLVRAVCHPFHLRKGRLTWNAFRPPAARADVSVMRHDYVGAGFCKQKAQKLTERGKSYCGLAFFRAGAVREAGADVIDSRGIYHGHADIMHVVNAPPKGEPPSPGELEILRDACKHIVKRSVYIVDPAPDGKEWTADPVNPPECENC